MWFFDIFKKKAIEPEYNQNHSARTIEPTVITERMVNDLALAEAIYTNNPPWLNEDNPPMMGTGIGALVAAEVARLITLESKITVNNDDKINHVLQTYVIRNLRTEIEKGWALGGLVFKPYYNNANFELDSGNNVVSVQGDLKISFSYPSQFLIDAYDNSGAILRIRFFQTIVKDRKYYTLVETQDFDELSKSLTITNTLYETVSSPTKYKWDDLGNKILPLGTIERWKNLLPRIVFSNVTGCLIGFFKPALANNSNFISPYGLSPLVRAANAIHRADRSYNNLDWEMDASLARVYVDEKAMPSFEEDIPKKVSKLFVQLLGDNDKKFYDKYSPSIREESYLNVFNSHLRQIEDIVGLAHGTLSNAEQVARTATEIATMKQRTYATISDNQSALETAIRQLSYAIQVWLNPAQMSQDIDMTFDFDDSIVSNPAEQLTLYMTLQNAGNIPAYKTNMMYFRCSEEEAKALVSLGREEKFNEMNDKTEDEFE